MLGQCGWHYVYECVFFQTCLSSTLVITMPQDLDSISILESLPANQTMTTYFGVDMNDTIQPVNFQIRWVRLKKLVIYRGKVLNVII